MTRPTPRRVPQLSWRQHPAVVALISYAIETHRASVEVDSRGLRIAGILIATADLLDDPGRAAAKALFELRRQTHRIHPHPYIAPQDRANERLKIPPIYSNQAYAIDIAEQHG